MPSPKAKRAGPAPPWRPAAFTAVDWQRLRGICTAPDFLAGCETIAAAYRFARRTTNAQPTAAESRESLSALAGVVATLAGELEALPTRTRATLTATAAARGLMLPRFGAAVGALAGAIDDARRECARVKRQGPEADAARLEAVERLGDLFRAHGMRFSPTSRGAIDALEVIFGAPVAERTLKKYLATIREHSG